MQILTAAAGIALFLQQSLAAPDPQRSYGGPPSCPADQCFKSIRLNKPVAQLASSVCSKYIKYNATVSTATTKTITTVITSTSRVNQPQAPVTATATSLTTVTPPPTTQSSTCTTTTSTVQGVFSTYVNFLRRGDYPGAPRRRDLDERALPFIPNVMGAGCGSGQPFKAKISSACSCLLGKPKTSTCTRTSNVSLTTTVTSTIVVPAGTTTTTTTRTATAPVSTVTECQTATATTTVFAGGAELTCGAPVAAYTSQASLTCDNVAPPGETNAKFRIEGGQEGNIFDGCISTGPRNVTTPSGGTHLCDGTNNNANPSPGGTLTTAIDSSGRELGYGFDGTYSNQFQDFFISSISSTTQTGNQFWGVLRNFVFTLRGGCQEEVANGDEGLWAFDAFAPNRNFLDINPQVIVVNPAETDSITLTVTQVNPNTGTRSPASGASIGTASVADANGNIFLQVPSQPGCYQYKAEMTNAIRSPAVYLTVTESL